MKTQLSEESKGKSYLLWSTLENPAFSITWEIVYWSTKNNSTRAQKQLSYFSSITTFTSLPTSLSPISPQRFLAVPYFPHLLCVQFIDDCPHFSLLTQSISMKTLSVALSQQQPSTKKVQKPWTEKWWSLSNSIHNRVLFCSLQRWDHHKPNKKIF